MAAGHSEDVFHHVRDSNVFEVPHFLGTEIPLPEVFGFQITKFMVLEVLAGIIVAFVYIGLAKRIATGEPARGRFWNFWEVLALFIRDQVVRPCIGSGHDDHSHDAHGHGEDISERFGEDEEQPIRSVMAASHPEMGGHPADKYLPFIWSCFFFILISNLLGAIPCLGTSTGHLWVTAPLALTTLVVVIKAGCSENGIIGYLKALVPHMELPGPMGLVLLPMIWVIEVAGLLIKHSVLAVRLFANMMAGHTVIAVMLGFIASAMAPDQAAWLAWLVTPASIFGQVLIGLLELFFSLVQAYVFSLLAALFIGAAVNPH